MKARLNSGSDQSATATLSQRTKVLPGIVRSRIGQRPAATYRDAMSTPLEAIEATAVRTIAETWGCWN
jgi:hypothetical protein